MSRHNAEPTQPIFNFSYTATTEQLKQTVSNPLYESHPHNSNLTKTDSFHKQEPKSISIANNRITPYNPSGTPPTPTKYHLPTEYAKTEIIEKINKIFLNNAQFSSLENDYFISQQKIINILTKSKVLSKGVISLSQVDILFRSITPNSNKCNLLDFINFITKLVKTIYTNDFDENPKEVMNYFLDCFFFNYEDYLIEDSSNNFIENATVNNCTIKTIETIVTTEIDNVVVEMLNSIYNTFKTLYMFYFQNELNIKNDYDKLQQQSLKDAITFCKDFEILPLLLNESQFVTYFNFVLKYDSENPSAIKELFNKEDEKRKNTCTHTQTKTNTNVNVTSCSNCSKEKGKCYQLSMFILMFYHFALIVYYKQIQLNFQTKKANDVDIVLFFLERLENSKGWSCFTLKRNRTNTSNTLSFIPTNKTISKLKQKLNTYEINNETNTKGNTVYDKNTKLTTIANTNVLKQYNSKHKKYNLNTLLNVDSEIIAIINEHINGLSELFHIYSRISDKTTFNRMALSSYVKFLKDADIVFAIPDSMRKVYNELGNSIMKKTFNVSQIKQYNPKEKSSISLNKITLTDDEKLYTKNISMIVNSSSSSKEDKISESDANVIFNSLTGYKNFNNNNKYLSFDKKKEIQNKQNIPSKMDFYLFIKSFELLAVKLYPNQTLNDAFMQLFNLKILPMLPTKTLSLLNNTEIQQAIEKVNTPKIKEFIIKFAQVIQPHYEMYSDASTGNIHFVNYLQFYKDYSLFPDLVNMVKLKNVFFTLKESMLSVNSCHNTLNNNKKESKNYISEEADDEGEREYKGDEITFGLFVESLGITAMMFNFKNILNDMDKMLYLVERINQSKACMNMNVEKHKGMNVNKELSEFIRSIKKDYPVNEIRKVRLNSNSDVIEEKDVKFDDIYQDEEKENVSQNNDNTNHDNINEQDIFE